jgi:hypothetical protein
MLTFLFLLAPGSVLAQGEAIDVQVYPSAATIAANGIQSVTAEVTGSTNHSVTWSTSGGSPTVINSSGTTVGVKNATAATVTLTATSAADNTKSATMVIKFVPDPTPLTSHPRLLLTSSDIARLQGWAVSGNPFYANVLQSAANQAKTYADAHWSWTFNAGTGLPDGGWQDNGGTGYVGDPTESFAELFAFMSMVDPSSQANRDGWGKRSRDMLMYVINNTVQGTANSAFRYTSFSLSDRARYWGEAYGLVLDWLQCATNCGSSQASYLSVSDKSKIRTVYMMWGQLLVSSGTTNFTHPIPIGSASSNRSLLLTNTRAGLYWTGNNYWNMQMRNQLLMGLAIDAADDPKVNGGNAINYVDTGGNGNTLRAFAAYGVGSFLYQAYEMFEEPQIVASALGVSASGLGLERGGNAPATLEYGPQTIGYIMESLLALHTSGNDDPTTQPQLSLASSSAWTLFSQSILAQLSPQTFAGGGITQGPSHYLAGYGDMQRAWAHPIPFYQPLHARAIYNYDQGNASDLNIERYIIQNLLDGGSSAQFYWSKGTFDGGSGSYSRIPIEAFMVFDPTASAPTDPRVSGYPLDYYAAGEPRYAGRTDWTANASWFTYRCSWEMQDHQHQDCGMFEFYRKGEWITKARHGYPDDVTQYGLLSTDETQGFTIFNGNDTGNAATTLLSGRGSQWETGTSSGDPTTIASYGPSYFYAQSDSTNLYNSTHYGTFTDVTHASRSILWLKPSIIVIYDRANSVSTGKFKRFNMATLVSPTVTGRSAAFATAGGQQVYIDGLLPTGNTASMTKKSLDPLVSIASLEPEANGYWLLDQDIANPQVARYLHILQVVDAPGQRASDALVQSSAGTAFDGATVGTTCVMFITTPSQLGSFSSTAFTVPNTVVQYYVSGLTPNTDYQLTVTPSGTNFLVTVKKSGSTFTDSAGVLAFPGSNLSPATVPLAPPTILGDTVR